MTEPRKRGLGLHVLFVLSALVVGVVGSWGYARYSAFTDTPIGSAKVADRVIVERGDSFARVLGRLRAAGIVQGHDLEWQALAKQLGAAGKIQVGEYAIDPTTTPRILLQRMRDGRIVSHRFTIVEGWNIRDLRAALGRATPLGQTIATMDDAALMAAVGAPGVHPEGQFLPETYTYSGNDRDVDVLKRAHADLQRALDAAWESRAKGLPLKSRDDALTLASIVEKETGIASERAQIAGVFARRLTAGMRLQTDPTVIYGIGPAYAGNLRRTDLTTDTPYNTYTRDGLPPTPIAMAGGDALQAATHPATGDTLYFVAVGDGSGRHVFSSTLSAHQTAVRAYVARYRAQYGPR